MARDEIVTGVDKLIQIIDASGGKISLKDAMKQMNVSKNLIEEWANTLEESKAITIEYKLFNTYLVRGISKKELIKKAKDITLKEEAFKENVLVALKEFKAESSGLLELEKEFEGLSEHLKEKGKAVESQLQHLYEFDKLNKQFEDELKDVDQRSTVYVNKIEESIQDKKDEYETLLKKLDTQKQEIESKSKKLQEFIDMAVKINKEIDESKQKVSLLQQQVKSIKPEIELLQKNSIEQFIKQQKEAVQRISSKQSDFLKEIMLKRRFMKLGMKESQMIKDKLDLFFHRQQAVQKKYDKLKKEKDEMLNEFSEIIKLSEQYRVMSKRKDITKEFDILKKRYGNIDKKSEEFKKELKELKEIVEGKKMPDAKNNDEKTKKKPKK